MNIKQFGKALLNFCKQNDIKVYTYESASNALKSCGLSGMTETSSAFCLRCPSGSSSQATDCIFYDKECSRESRTYAVCHELGHILLGHLDARTKLSDNARESEANIFASVLMAQMLFASIQERHNEEEKGKVI